MEDCFVWAFCVYIPVYSCRNVQEYVYVYRNTYMYTYMCVQEYGYTA